MWKPSRAGQEAPEQVLPGLTRDVEGDALLAGVVPPIVETAVGIDPVVDKGAAPAPRASRRRLDLDHARAAVGQELARPLVAAIGQLDHGESVVHAIHLRLLTSSRRVSTFGIAGLTRCSSNSTRSALKPVRIRPRSLSSQAQALVEGELALGGPPAAAPAPGHSAGACHGIFCQNRASVQRDPRQTQSDGPLALHERPDGQTSDLSGPIVR